MEASGWDGLIRRFRLLANRVQNELKANLRSAVRNPFDQYRDHENRLTHALACCLAGDRRFLCSFVQWVPDEAPPKTGDLQIVEQSLPGEPEPDEEVPEQ